MGLHLVDKPSVCELYPDPSDKRIIGLSGWMVSKVNSKLIASFHSSFRPLSVLNYFVNHKGRHEVGRAIQMFELFLLEYL